MTRERVEVNGHDETEIPNRGSVSARTAPPSRKNPIPEPGAIYFEDIEPEEGQQFLRGERRVPVRRSVVGKKTLARAKTAAGLALSLALVGSLAITAYGYGIHAPRFRIHSSDNIDLSGVHNASRIQVMEVVGADIGRNIFFVPLDERQRQLRLIPWVEEATVMRLLPNRIAVNILERTPVAFVQIGPRISLIDANGVVMGMPANRQTKYSFPVIRGIAESEPLSSRAVVMKIYARLANDLDQGNFTKQVSEVDLSDPEDVKVTANDSGGTTLVHLGSSDFLQRYKLFVAHIGEWRQQFQNVQSVDMRYDGQIVVNPDRADENKVGEPRSGDRATSKSGDRVIGRSGDRKPVKHSAWKKSKAKS